MSASRDAVSSMTRWLLTGGAGYIGAHVARDLLAGYRARIPEVDALFRTG